MSETPVTNKTARNAWLLVAGLAAVLLLVLVFNPLEPFFLEDARSHPGVGKRLASVELRPLVDATSAVDLAALKGNVVLVNVWAVWCPGCREEMPHLAAINEKYAARSDFRLVTICAGADESLEETRGAAAEYLQRAGLRVPTYGDTSGVALAELERSRVFDGAIPATFLVDRQGVVRAVWRGYVPGQEAKIERILASLLVQR